MPRRDMRPEGAGEHDPIHRVGAELVHQEPRAGIECRLGELDGADVIINLAGRSVNCRYNSRNRREILDSRVNSTRVLGEAISKAGKPPGVWLQASTATIYAHRFDATNDELTGVLGGSESGAPDTWNFSIDVATRWERALNEAYTPRTRKVKMRTAIVMSPDPGGPFDILLGLVRRGLGGKSGSGRQFVSRVWRRSSSIACSLSRKRIGRTRPVRAET